MPLQVSLYLAVLPSRQCIVGLYGPVENSAVAALGYTISQESNTRSVNSPLLAFLGQILHHLPCCGGDGVGLVSALRQGYYRWC